eukprot:2982488-Karenia_brevis.AAC.1
MCQELPSLTANPSVSACHVGTIVAQSSWRMRNMLFFIAWNTLDPENVGFMRLAPLFAMRSLLLTLTRQMDYCRCLVQLTKGNGEQQVHM